MSGITEDFLQSPAIDFGVIPVSPVFSAAQQIQTVNPHAATNYVNAMYQYIGGVNVQLTATVGDISVEIYDGNAPGGLLAYSAKFTFTGVGETLSDRLGEDYVPCYNSAGIWVHVSGSVAAMQCVVTPYMLSGNVIPRLP